MSAPHSDDVPRNRLAATMADLDELSVEPSWGDINGKPTTFPPSTHKHPVGDLTTSGTASSTTYLRGDGTWATPTNTTYSVMSEAEATAGTATTARTTSAAGLKGAIQRWATGTYSTAISAIGQALNRAANAAEARAAIGAVANNDSRLSDARTPTAHRHPWGEIDNKPSTFAPSSHTHAVGDVTGSQSALDGKADTTHSHSWGQITGKPSTFAPSSHSHSWGEVTGKPSTFTPASHSHSVADVTGLQSALDGKATASHSHAEFDRVAAAPAMWYWAGTNLPTSASQVHAQARVGDMIVAPNLTTDPGIHRITGV